jgi:hypothetical protein
LPLTLAAPRLEQQHAGSLRPAPPRAPGQGHHIISS